MRANAEDVRRLEERITRLRNVEAAAIHQDEQGQVEAVDVIADRGRSPQMIVRDIEILFREAGLQIDHRKIGVAVLDDPSRIVRSVPDEASAAEELSPALRAAAAAGGETPRLAVIDLEPETERLRLVAVHSSTRHGSFAVEVELALGALEGVPGRAEGPAQEALGCAALVARASLDAVRNLLQPGYETQLREIRLVDMAGAPVVLLSVDFGDGRRLQRLTGACEQRGSLYEATVYATLDALNRPLGRARFREFAVVGAAAHPAAGDQDVASA